MFFQPLRPWLSLGTRLKEHVRMPRNVAQFTGVVVTAIIVMGTDMDVFYAMPLGIMAGTLATLFVAMSGRLENVVNR
jgi:hypothetical protein